MTGSAVVERPVAVLQERLLGVRRSGHSVQVDVRLRVRVGVASGTRLLDADLGHLAARLLPIVGVVVVMVLPDVVTARLADEAVLQAVAFGSSTIVLR